MGTDNSAGDDSSAPRRLGSVADVQKVEEAYARSLEQSYGKLPSFVNTSDIDARVESSIKQSIDSYARQQYQQLLSSDLETQAAPNFAGHNYSAYTATQLKQMVSSNMDPTSAGDSASAWNGIGNDYVTVAQDLGQAVGGSEYGWEGDAGDAARGFIGGVSKWAGSAGQGAQLAGNRLAVQSEAASTAKNSMPTDPTEPPTAADVSSAMLQGGLNPAAGAAKLNSQFAQAAADHAEAVQAARIYDSSLATSGEKFPAFQTPPAFDAGSGASGNAPSPGGGGVSGLGAAGNGPRGAGAGPNAKAGVRGGRSSGSSGSSDAGASHALVTPPTPGSGADSPSSSTGQAGFEPGGTTSAGPGGAMPGGGSTSSGGLGSDPVVSGSLAGDAGVGVGVIGGLASGGGVGRGLANGSGQGGARSGVGAAAVGEEEVEGGAGTRGGATGEPGMMAPRGSGKREDAEHKRPRYLLNPDPDETFGPDERVVPPVIGE